MQFLHKTRSAPTVNKKSTWDEGALERKLSGLFGNGKNRVVNDSSHGTTNRLSRDCGGDNAKFI